MYQFNMSINNNNSQWFYDVEKLLSIKIKNYFGIMATKKDAARLNISIACESKHKQQVQSVIKECITEMFLSAVKFDYLSKILNLPTLKKESYNLLLHTLVVFDREAEENIIRQALNFGNNLALDGLFNFRLTELKHRWNEISLLAMNNAGYLNNDDTLNELLKFLMSAVSPKIQKLDIVKSNGQYKIKGQYQNGKFEYKIIHSEQLMVYLINIAPLELTLYGCFDDDVLLKRLTSIFDAKPKNAVND